jgi:hypothetical protein
MPDAASSRRSRPPTRRPCGDELRVPPRPDPFTVDRTWTVAVSPQRLWDAATRVDEMPRWWPWLEDFWCDRLETGGTAAFSVRAPLPYRLRFRLTFDDVVPGERVAVSVAGDLTGRAALEPTPDELGCRARLSWHLRPHHPLVRAAGLVARPALRWGHDRIVSQAARQLLDAAFR